MKPRRSTLKRRRGQVALLVIMVAPLMLGAAAFAVDFVYFHSVRQELQAAADTAALAGARRLSGGGSTGLDWVGATQQAQSVAAQNQAGREALTQASVLVGYWSLSDSSAGLRPLPYTPNANDIPAVQVTVTRSPGVNGGAVSTFFARIWGRTSQSLSATAAAGVPSPSSMDSATVFPFVMTQCMFDNYWNSSSSPPGPRSNPSTGQPYVFQLGSTYHYSSCTAGNWTSFLVDNNNVPTIRALIADGNPTGLSLNDLIWIQPGTSSTLFQSVASCSAAGNRSCEWVVIPVVQTVSTHSLVPIRAFACMRLLNAAQGQQYIEAEMSNQCPPAASSGPGPNYGAVSPPSLLR